MAKQLDLAQHANVFRDKAEGLAFFNYMTPILTNFANVIDRLSSRALNSAGLAIGSTSKKKIKIVNATLCCVNGVMVPIAAATEVPFTATTHDIADGYINMFVLVVDSAGAITVLPGTAALTTGTVAAVVPPVIPAHRAVIGAVVISTAAAIFDATSTDLDAVTLTVTYHDCPGSFDPKASITA